MRLIDADAFLERIQNDTSLCAEIKLYGTIVRDDLEEPFETIIKLDNGRYLRAVECQYSYIDEEVSDYVCEWRKIKGNSCLFETSCNNISGMYRGFNFCPYCGNKIKVTEI